MKYYLFFFLSLPFIHFGQNLKLELYFPQNKITTSFDSLSKIKNNDFSKIELLSFTDSVGSSLYNKNLAIKRALNVVEKLKYYGIDTSIIDIKIIGESDSNQLFRKVVLNCFSQTIASKIRPNKFHDFNNNTPDIFTIDYRKDTTLITSNNNIITIFGYGIYPVKSDSVTLTVNEYLDNESIITNNLNTTSNGNLLVSDGMIKIKGIGTRGDSVIVNSIQIEMRKKTNGMKLFFADKQLDSSYNWYLPKKTSYSRGNSNYLDYCSSIKTIPKHQLKPNTFKRIFISKLSRKRIDSLNTAKSYCDSIEVINIKRRKELQKQRTTRRINIENKISENLQIPFQDIQFYTFNINKFRIINADKFYTSIKPKSTLKINYNFPNTETRIILKNFNSMLLPNLSGNNITQFNSIPIEEPFYIVSLNTLNNVIYFSKTEFTCHNRTEELNI